MRPTDQKVFESALLMSTVPGLAPFLGWLRERREEARSMCTMGLSDDVTHRAQGRAQEVSEILDAIDGAPGHLEKLRAQRKPGTF